MIDNVIQNVEYCRNIVESVSGILYYSHIPTAIIALVTALLIYIKNRKLILAQILLLIAICFSIWSTLDLLIWFNYDNVSLLMFSWSLIEIFSVLLFVLSLYFLHVFTHKGDISVSKKLFILVLVLPVILLSSTNLNIIGYDAQECIAIEASGLSNYTLGLKIFLSLWMVLLILKSFKNAEPIVRKKLALVSVGMLSFIFSFLISGFIAGLTESYIIEIYGLMAMIIFVVTLARLVVLYGEFNIKVFSSQILVMGLVALIAAQFAFIQNPINRLLNSLTLLIVVFFGWTLVRSVKREVEQREKIQKLAEELEKANFKLKELDQLKSEFLSLATHQIRAPLTAIKGYSSMLIEGDFGVLPQKAKDSVETIFKSCQNLINIVGDFLNISRIEQGRMVYEKSIFDIANLTKEVAKELEPNVKKAGLSLDLNIPDDLKVEVNADIGKIKQVIGNLIDNAIKYTVKGSINISVSTDAEKAFIKIKDTGIGIDKEEIGKLFTKFTRAKDANKTNVIGTGLGLYIAKKMTEAHHGDIKIESEGLGKGTTFIIELPRVKS